MAKPIKIFGAAACVVSSVGLALSLWAQAPSGVTAYEGARLIVGDGRRAIEDSVFLVQNGQFLAAGKKGSLKIPAGAAHVNLTGKTVMPAMVDLHGHLGYQNVPAGTMSKETFTRENLIDHLQRLAYYGIGAVVDVASLTDRSDMHGGRTNWGDVPLRVRDEIIPGTALFKTAGDGIAAPGGGPIGHPSRADVPYPVATPEDARAAVDDYVKMKPSFIKIWEDDRGGTKPKMSPAVYKAVLDEAHKFNVPVAAHNVTLADAKNLVRDGIEGWLHVPVRGGELVDDELVKLVKDRVRKKDRPNMWMTPALAEPWMSLGGGQRPSWLDDPTLHDTYSDAAIRQFWGDPLMKMKPEEIKKAHDIFENLKSNGMKLRAAGIKGRDGHGHGANAILDRLFHAHGSRRTRRHGPHALRGDRRRHVRPRAHRRLQYRARRKGPSGGFHRARRESLGENLEHAPDQQSFPARAGSSPRRVSRQVAIAISKIGLVGQPFRAASRAYARLSMRRTEGRRAT